MSVVLNIEYLGVNMMHQIFPFLEIKAVNRFLRGRYFFHFVSFQINTGKGTD